ncbi:hypothetical protein FNJ47_46470 [Bradyrhizobium sp. UFLA 03-164]|uniref:Uncharacterized protein n=1 Tax=Bradyrhizobium uaiense TaxID=2594946 RepID=A0A6P1BXB3_9BRAD|nr:hypothetical protein [Bradyrhizobium uaiense]
MSSRISPTLLTVGSIPKGAARPQIPAARHGRGVEKSTLVHAIALQRPNGIKLLYKIPQITQRPYSFAVRS